MTGVTIHVQREEVESLEMALRALTAEQTLVERHGCASSVLSVAIDDLHAILHRVRAQQEQHSVVALDPWSRRVS